MSTSTSILNDLEDARQELKALEKQEKRGRKHITAGIVTLSGMAAALILTGEGLYAWLLFPATAFFCAAAFELYQTNRRQDVPISNGSYITRKSPVGVLDEARRKVSKLEREYSAAILSEAR